MVWRAKRVPAFRMLILATAAVALAACSSTAHKLSADEQAKAVALLIDGKPSELTYLYRNVIVDGRKDAVLNWMRIGKAALDMGRLDLAGEAFDQALAGIEAVYADNPQAEKARSVWNRESVKDFKGEPHERAMAYYYRGLIYLMTGDLDNARASFKGALLQDSFAESERHRADFAIAAFLEGWTNRCGGTAVQALAPENFQEAQTARGTLTPPEPSDRVLVVMEAGAGPTKEGVGPYRERLAYREQRGPKQGYRVRIGQQERPARLAEDLFFQAITRGGREMDKILAVKADTKQATEAVATGAVVVGLGVMNASQYQYNSRDRGAGAAAGLAIALVGVLAQAAAQSMTAEADTRHWWQLPHSVFVATLPASRITGPDGIDILHEGGSPAVKKRELMRLASIKDCTLVWMPAAAVSIEAPPMAETPAKPEKANAKASAKRATREAKTTEPGYGNCRSAAGSLLNLEPETCKAINGSALSPAPVKG